MKSYLNREVANYFGLNYSSLISVWKQKFFNSDIDTLSKIKEYHQRIKIQKGKNKIL